jgi:L-amino acid N-acyltransferase YncA
VQIRPFTASDWSEVERIYAEGIGTGNATFEAEPPSWEVFDNGRHPDLRLVAVDETGIVGWAAASPTSARPVYSGVVEHSVYVADAARGRGIGAALLDALVDAARRHGVWTIQSGIFPENMASLALHDSRGFRRVGHRERIALMSYGPFAGTWRDTILVELRLP